MHWNWKRNSQPFTNKCLHTTSIHSGSICFQLKWTILWRSIWHYDIAIMDFAFRFLKMWHSSKWDSINKQPPTSVFWKQARRWDAVTIQPSCYWRLRGEWNHIKYVSGGRSSLYASSLITLTINIIIKASEPAQM